MNGFCIESGVQKTKFVIVLVFFLCKAFPPGSSASATVEKQVRLRIVASRMSDASFNNKVVQRLDKLERTPGCSLDASFN